MGRQVQQPYTESICVTGVRVKQTCCGVGGGEDNRIVVMVVVVMTVVVVVMKTIELCWW